MEKSQRRHRKRRVDIDIGEEKKVDNRKAKEMKRTKGAGKKKIFDKRQIEKDTQA